MLFFSVHFPTLFYADLWWDFSIDLLTGFFYVDFNFYADFFDADALIFSLEAETFLGDYFFGVSLCFSTFSSSDSISNAYSLTGVSFFWLCYLFPTDYFYLDLEADCFLEEPFLTDDFLLLFYADSLCEFFGTFSCSSTTSTLESS